MSSEEKWFEPPDWIQVHNGVVELIAKFCDRCKHRKSERYPRCYRSRCPVHFLFLVNDRMLVTLEKENAQITLARSEMKEFEKIAPKLGLEGMTEVK